MAREFRTVGVVGVVGVVGLGAGGAAVLARDSLRAPAPLGRTTGRGVRDARR